MDLSKGIQYIKGVGPTKAGILNRLRYIYIRRFNLLFPKRA
jgi:hypothetical protein